MVRRVLLPLISLAAHGLALTWLLQRIGVPARRNTLRKAIAILGLWRLTGALLRRDAWRRRAPWLTAAIYASALVRAYRLPLPHACAIAILHSVIIGDLGG